MIDFHCHLDLYSDPKQVAERCEKEGIYVLSVTTTPSAWPGTKSLQRGRIRTALGLHPQLAHERFAELSYFDEFLSDTRYVGEIGLDGAPEFRQSWSRQLDVFDHVLRSCANAGGKVLSIHSRRASGPVLEKLASHPGAGLSVLHWFSGTPDELNRAVELGCWFSIGPAMLRSKTGRELASRMPRDRVLTESDGPFARLEDRPLFPWDAGMAIEVLAQLWKSDQDTVRAVLLYNLRTLTTQSFNDALMAQN
jgi:TatD DNase family protein